MMAEEQDRVTATIAAYVVEGPPVPPTPSPWEQVLPLISSVMVLTMLSTLMEGMTEGGMLGLGG